MNRLVLAASALMMAALTAIFFYEAFFALPPCPDGQSWCAMRDGHVAGAKLLGWVLAGAWSFVGLWFAMTRRVERKGGGTAWLTLFWVTPGLVVAAIIFLLH